MMFAEDSDSKVKILANAIVLRWESGAMHSVLFSVLVVVASL